MPAAGLVRQAASVSSCDGAHAHYEAVACVAAMSVSAPTLRWNDQRAEELGRLITKAAVRLSARLGHQSR